MFLLLSSIVYQSPLKEDESDLSVTIIMTLIMMFLVGLTALLIHQRIQTSKWQKGIFPLNLKYNSDNLLKAYISLSGVLIRVNPEESNPKFYYAVSYFNKKFPTSNLDFKFLLRFSLRYPIKSNLVCEWLNDKIKEDVYKLHLIYFLTGLAMVDSNIKVSEYKLLLNLVNRLNLNEKDFRSIVAMYMKSADERNGSGQARNANIKFDSKRKKSLKVLGLLDGVSFEDIKKAYRKLAMKYHPDKFERQGPDQVEIAKNRFLIIQEAYDYLEKSFN